MGLLNKLRQGFQEDDYDDDFYDDYDDEPVKKEPSAPIVGNWFVSKTKAGAKQSNMGVVLVRPQSYSDSPDISYALLNDRVVVLNLEGLRVDVAQRIVDFTTGVCVAIDGSFKSVSKYVFIIAPKNINVDGELDDLLLNNFGTVIE
jgi:cell division inhibitor SepF